MTRGEDCLVALGRHAIIGLIIEAIPQLKSGCEIIMHWLMGTISLPKSPICPAPPPLTAFHSPRYIAAVQKQEADTFLCLLLQNFPGDQTPVVSTPMTLLTESLQFTSSALANNETPSGTAITQPAGPILSAQEERMRQVSFSGGYLYSCELCCSAILCQGLTLALKGLFIPFHSSSWSLSEQWIYITSLHGPSHTLTGWFQSSWWEKE